MNEVVENIGEYILGGRAEFTLVQDGSCEVRYKLCANDNRSCFFVYTEGVSSRKLIYHGHILPRDMSFHIGKKVNPDEYNVTAIKALGWLLRNYNHMPSRVHVIHNGKCSRCGRKLKDLESLRTGLGPVCRGKSMGM